MQVVSAQKTTREAVARNNSHNLIGKADLAVFSVMPTGILLWNVTANQQLPS